ncbi:MAG TPA: ferrochelatase [Acidimicrobiales bacterium]|nr:ferrochelatase [Acidimicrobiales bacterium]
MTTGVLALSYGAPERGEVAAYYTMIRHGRPPTPEQLADLQQRYDAIGGTSPLAERTAAQAIGVARELERRAPDRYLVEGATKYAAPSIEDAVERLLGAGVTEIVGLVLAPLSATMSTGQYHDRAVAAIAERVAYRGVWSWWDAPGFAELVGARVTAACASFRGSSPLVLFTAHSLPVRAVESGGDYADQLAAAAASVAKAAALDTYLVCWQSAGRTDEAWLGPDLLEVLRGLDPTAVPSVVVCPVGFVADHLEVLYDVDVEATELARTRRISLRRTASLNDDPALCEILADLVEGAMSPS